MALRLYDTSSRQKVAFEPKNRDHVRMYVCGPTVYDFAHIGNARPVIVFDVLFRLLRHVWGAEHVVYSRNITDVDDKINARAAERGISIRELTDGTLAQFHADVDALGCLRPTSEPRATDHIEAMKALIERLVARGVAYVAEEHVLFSVGAMEALEGVPRYGALARRSLDEMLAGARVDVAPYKRDAMDFVLWKPSSGEQPGWPSPCGIATPGRPGWHIECSAMSMAELLEPFGGGLSCDDPERNVFDIHGGGIDLVFPHHENEVAQTCCALGTPRMAKVWMHNGFLQVEGQKMSKSLGNFVTIRDLLETDAFGGRSWPGEVLRLAMLRTHYRQPIDWTVRALEEAEQTLDEWYRVTENWTGGGELDARVISALENDLNTPEAVSALHALSGDAKAQGAEGASAAGSRLVVSARLLGLLQSSAGDWFATRVPAISVAERRAIDDLLASRSAARAARNWAESDRLRDELAGMGIVVKDAKDGTTWEFSR